MNLLERLEKAGITWERPFCELGEGRVYISFQRDHPHAIGYKQYQARAYVLVGGVWKHKVFTHTSSGLSVPEKRAEAVAVAQERAEMRLGEAEWVAGPFPDSWQTKDTRKRALALLDEMSAS